MLNMYFLSVLSFKKELNFETWPCRKRVLPIAEIIGKRTASL
jgi:hypothetical protein